MSKKIKPIKPRIMLQKNKQKFKTKKGVDKQNSKNNKTMKDVDEQRSKSEKTKKTKKIKLKFFI
jgi:co-chaperonin GroES (HSP10)